jgi:hypothetical protein
MQPGFICVAGIDPDSGRQIRPVVPYRAWGKLRAVIQESNGETEISITDMRLWQCDHQTPRLRLIADVSNRIQSVPAILAVGLTRPFQKSPTASALHWLQLNNIHLQDDPLGESLSLSPDDDELWLSTAQPPLARAAKASSK